MFWNTIPNEERLLLWKKLRNEILALPLKDRLEEISKFCSSIPFGARTLDYYSPLEWPTPWEILFHGSFCTSSISLLMFYTLTLLPGDKVLELILVEDTTGIYMLPLIDNQYVLNYHLGQVSMYSDVNCEFKELKRYSESVIKRIS